MGRLDAYTGPHHKGGTCVAAGDKGTKTKPADVKQDKKKSKKKSKDSDK